MGTRVCVCARVCACVCARARACLRARLCVLARVSARVCVSLPFAVSIDERQVSKSISSRVVSFSPVVTRDGAVSIRLLVPIHRFLQGII